MPLGLGSQFSFALFVAFSSYEINEAQRLNQNATEDASGLSPNSTYALVGFPTGATGSTETKNTTLPETIYAQVNKSSKVQPSS